MGLRAGLYHVTLVDLLLEERVEADPPRAFRIDLTHGREYRKSGRLPNEAVHFRTGRSTAAEATLAG